MNRREFIKAAGATTGPLSLVRAAQTAGIGKKPNILIVVCDQMNLDAISAYRKHFDHPSWLCHWVDTPNLDELAANGVTKVQTPNIDRRAAQGCSFTDAHAASAVCSPSRYGLLTGTDPLRRNFWGPTVPAISLSARENGSTSRPRMQADSNRRTSVTTPWERGALS